MSDSVDRVFTYALNTVKKIPRTGSARPPPADRLMLYGLYKQSMEGDVEGVMDRPEGDSPEVQAEREKWDAWYAQRGLSRTEAKRRYITTLIETMHRYASQTPEARELISELEFVWDQIKSNTSSSSSSPLRAGTVPMVPQLQQPNYGSIGGRLARSGRDNGDDIGPGRDSRLRVLSPVSQPDEAFVQRKYNPDGDEEEDEEEEEEEEEEEDEEYQEAHDRPYDDNEHITDEEHALRQPREISGITDSREIYQRKWRRRVEQALTKMTAEVAALREQMETRAINHRRRSNLWAWFTWISWVIVRQILWDMAILAAVLIWMRLRGDRRLEQKLKVGWAEVKKRLLRLWIFRPRSPSLP